MTLTDLSSLYDAPLDPVAMDFTTKVGKNCRECVFQRQRIAVCNRAVDLATRAGMPSCDDVDVIYVLRQTDPRQIPLIDQRSEVAP